MGKQLVIQVGQVEFGLSITNIISIEKMLIPSPVPLMPDYIIGIVDVRGKVIPVLDMNHILFSKKTNISDNTRLVLTDIEELTLALMVDEAKEIVQIEPEEIKPYQNVATAHHEFFAGVTSIDERLVSLLNIKELLSGLTNLNHIREEVEKQQLNEK